MTEPHKAASDVYLSVAAAAIRHREHSHIHPNKTSISHPCSGNKHANNALNLRYQEGESWFVGAPQNIELE